MGLLILEPRRRGSGRVPGTAFMGAGGSADSTTTSTELNPNLKYDLTGPEPIVLIPQPSNDPNDPLNWKLWERDIITLILCLASIMAATLGPILASTTMVHFRVWRVSLTQVPLLTGYHLCGVGVAGLMFVASARVWGKRHLYVLGTLLLVVSSALGGAAQTYRSFLWWRIIQGVAVCPFEALVNTSIGDMYCVHQRGIRMALSNFALFGGSFLTPVIVGKLTEEMGWRWPFYLVAIISGVVFPLVILWVPETSFRRSGYHNPDLASTLEPVERVPESHPRAGASDGNPQHSTTGPSGREEEKRAEAGGSASASVSGKRHSWVKRMALFNGRYTDENPLKVFLRPIVLLVHPAVVWGMLTQGTLIGWTVFIGVVIGAVFVLPPLLFTEVETGYMYIGPFIGALAGFALVGPLADWSARFLTKRNNGVYEPEFRIFLVIPQMITGCLGLYMFGYTALNTAKFGWFWPDFFFALEVMGMIIGAVASSLYLVDAHPDIAIESFTCLLLFKNFFSFALTWNSIDWVFSLGPRKLFRYIGHMQLCVCLLSVFMYICGKMNRDFMSRYDILKLTRLG